MKPENYSLESLPEIPEIGELYLRIKVSPSSKKQDIKLMSDNQTYKVYLQSPPVGGKANKEMINFFAHLYRLPKNKIKIISGEFTQIKLIKIKNV